MLCQAIKEFFEPIYQRKIDAQYDVLVTAGATSVLGFSMMSLINPGDEAVLFDPSFDNYRP
jgi:methionine aminotransferase